MVHYVTQFSVPTTSGTVSVIQRDAMRNTSELTAPGSLNTCPMCEGQRWIFNVSKFRSQSERPSNFRVKSLLKAFCRFDRAGTRFANNTIDSPSLFQLRHPDVYVWLYCMYLLCIYCVYTVCIYYMYMCAYCMYCVYILCVWVCTYCMYRCIYTVCTVYILCV